MLGFKSRQLIKLEKKQHKYDLRKKPTSDDAMKGLNEFLQRNFYIICVLAIIFLLIMFVICCYMIVGMSAVESGVTYNHIGDII